MLTKLQVRTAIQQAIDDPQAKRWTAANLDMLTTLVEDTMFETILDSFEYLTSQSDLVTPSSGVIALSSLTKRFYRVQEVIKVSDGSRIQPRLLPERVPQPSYFMAGETLTLDPSITGTNSVSVRYSFIPLRFNDLASDSTALPDYPDGHEAALIYNTAAWAITKGDAESMAQIGRLADLATTALLSHVARRYPIGADARVAQVKATLMTNLIGGQ